MRIHADLGSKLVPVITKNSCCFPNLLPPKSTNSQTRFARGQGSNLLERVWFMNFYSWQSPFKILATETQNFCLSPKRERPFHFHSTACTTGEDNYKVLWSYGKGEKKHQILGFKIWSRIKDIICTGSAADTNICIVLGKYFVCEHIYVCFFCTGVLCIIVIPRLGTVVLHVMSTT